MNLTLLFYNTYIKKPILVSSFFYCPCPLGDHIWSPKNPLSLEGKGELLAMPTEGAWVNTMRPLAVAHK